MSLIWCIRRGKDKGFKNDLVACVACNCRQRESCKPYAALSMEQIVAANCEAKQRGHQISGELPLFESAFRQHNEKGAGE